MNNWEAARHKLFGKQDGDKKKIQFAENWLDANFDALCANGQIDKAVNALGRYERLCNDFRHSFGCWEHEVRNRKGGSR